MYIWPDINILMRKLTGRKEEIEILKNAIKSDRPELIVVYGRRRVGKTFLVREVYKAYIKFELSGIHNASLKDQLKNFHLQLSSTKGSSKTPPDWFEAFYQLGSYFDKLRSDKKKVLFIDEFPWLDTRKSKFLPAFENFWNSYASKREDIIVVICGSAASYMIQRIINSKGGLHQRITQKIRLTPFNLNETEQFLKRKRLVLTRYDILQLYMVFGGIPYYLENVRPGDSVAQTVDRLCFSKNGFLRSEFNNIFASLFEHPNNHEYIIRTLSKVRKGMTRSEILVKSKVGSGGRMTSALQELEESGFIENYKPYKGVKDSLYRLTDEYSLFYLKYIEGSTHQLGGWLKKQGMQSYRIWSGYCFESVCIKHIVQIIKCLGISEIHSTYGSWIEKHQTKGAQIDLLIDRDDNIINLCEIKFYNAEFTIDKKYAMELANKIDAFKLSTGTKSSLFLTFITTYGLADNQYRTQLVQNELKLDDLFIEL